MSDSKEQKVCCSLAWRMIGSYLQNYSFKHAVINTSHIHSKDRSQYHHPLIAQTMHICLTPPKKNDIVRLWLTPKVDSQRKMNILYHHLYSARFPLYPHFHCLQQSVAATTLLHQHCLCHLQKVHKLIIISPPIASIKKKKKNLRAHQLIYTVPTETANVIDTFQLNNDTKIESNDCTTDKLLHSSPPKIQRKIKKKT